MRVHLLGLVLCLAAAMGASRAGEAARLYNQGLREEQAGHFAEAEQLYSRAATLDPNNRMYSIRAQAAHNITVPPKAEAPAVSGIPPTDARQNGRDMRPPPELLPTLRPEAFDLRGDARSVFESVAHAYGLDCIFDADYVPATNLHFRFQSPDYRETLQALEMATGSFLVPLSQKLFMVVKDRPDKRTQLEPYVAMTIAIPEASTPQEMTSIAQAVQQTIGLERVGLDSQQNLFVLRGPISKVVPARALFESLLRHHADVSIEMKIVEISKQDMLSYGLTLPNTFPIVSSDTVANVAVKLADLARLGLGGWMLGLGVEQAQLLAQMSASSGRSLMHAQLRSTDGKAATFHVGDRYPVLTTGYFGPTSGTGTSTTSTPSSVGSNPTGVVTPTPTPTAFGNVPNPAALVVADFNEDGISDIAAAASGGDEVAELIGNGPGTFANAVLFATGKTPSAIAAADLNGDTHVDLITADAGSNSLSILLGKGDGTFQEATHQAVGQNPMALAIEDFNGDGLLDIAVANADTNNISILLGAGDGTFKAGTVIPAGASPRALLTTDLNGDGILDLAVVNFASNDLWIFLGKGDGTFGTPTTYATGSGPSAIAASSLNADGTTDLVVANSGSNNVSIFLGSGTGLFAELTRFMTGASPVSIAISDINNDGIRDIATVDSGDGTMALLLGLGDGTFQTAITYQVGSGPRAIASGDFNRDLLQDFVVANFTASDFSILLGTGTAGFQDPNGNGYTGNGGQSYTPPPSFDFQDLGLLLKVTPHVRGAEGVTLDIDAAIKSLTGQKINGMPVISNRQLVSQIDLKNGEWGMVAGLLSTSDSRVLSGIPGLEQIPVVGKVLDKRTRDRESDELILLIRIHLSSLPADEYITRPVRLGSDTRPMIPH